MPVQEIAVPTTTYGTAFAHDLLMSLFIAKTFAAGGASCRFQCEDIRGWRCQLHGLLDEDTRRDVQQGDLHESNEEYKHASAYGAG